MISNYFRTTGIYGTVSGRTIRGKYVSSRVSINASPQIFCFYRCIAGPGSLRTIERISVSANLGFAMGRGEFQIEHHPKIRFSHMMLITPLCPSCDPAEQVSERVALLHHRHG